MPHRTVKPGTNFEDTETTALEFLRIIGAALPKTADKEKVAAMMTVIDILSRVPMNEFANLRDAVADFQRMTPSHKEDVLSDIRRKITELIIG